MADKDAPPDFMAPPENPKPSSRMGPQKILAILTAIAVLAEIAFLIVDGTGGQPQSGKISPSDATVNIRRDQFLLEQVIRSDLASAGFYSPPNLTNERLSLPERSPVSNASAFHIAPDGNQKSDWTGWTSTWRRRVESLNGLGDGGYAWEVVATGDGITLAARYADESWPLLTLSQKPTEQPPAEKTKTKKATPAAKAPSQPKKKKPVARTEPKKSAKRVLSLIIDDLGNPSSYRKIQDLLASGYPLAYAILPSTPDAQRIAQSVHEAGMTVMIHQPMEPYRYPEIDPGPRLVTLAMDKATTQKILRENIKLIPHAVGMNNHTGSRYSEQTDRMGWVVEVLLEHNFFFIDSRTSSKTVAAKIARKRQLPVAERNVFLDDDRSEKAIAKEWRRALAVARKKGSAVAIGHPHKETVAFLLKNIPLLEKQGYSLEPITRVIR